MQDQVTTDTPTRTLDDSLRAARALFDRNDLPGALAAYAETRTLFPGCAAAYHEPARTLVDAGDLDEAETLLEYAMTRFPDDAGIAVAFAQLADRRQDHAAAAYRWQHVRASFPDHSGADGSVATRPGSGSPEASREIASAAQDRPGDDPAPAVARGWNAFARRDLVDAAAQFADVRQRFPGHPAGYAGAISALRELGQLDEAETLLREAMVLFPDNLSVLIEYPRLAMKRRDWPEAVARWLQVRDRLRSRADAWTGEATSLREMRQVDQAETLLREAIALFPGDPRVAMDLAVLANVRRDWPDAVQRWADMRERFPDHPGSYPGGSWAYRETGDLDAAEAMLADASARFPDHAEIAAERAMVAKQRQDWAAAAQRWTAVRRMAPANAAAWLGESEALAHLGRHDEVDAILNDACGNFPADHRLFLRRAEVVARQGNHERALRLLEDAHDRFPSDGPIEALLSRTRKRLAETTRPAPASPVIPASPVTPAETPVSTLTATQAATPATMADAELAMKFESLGGHGHGCEFGLFQRHCGAEPLGLLRWADLSDDLLTKALQNRLEGVGDVENTLVFIPEGHVEWWTRDTRYWMAMRTFVKAEGTPLDRMTRQACQRLQFLRRKLIEELEQGSKIFVFKDMYKDLSDPQIDALHAAVRSYGDSTLLYIRYADAAHPDGTVALVRPGLMIGRLAQFAFSRTNEPLGHATASLKQVCAAALRLWAPG